MRRLAGSWISSGDRCAAPVTIIKEGTTKKCYLSPEYNMLPITWTVQGTLSVQTTHPPPVEGEQPECDQEKDRARCERLGCPVVDRRNAILDERVVLLAKGDF